MFKASHGARGGELGIYSFPDQSHDPDVALLMIGGEWENRDQSLHKGNM